MPGTREFTIIAPPILRSGCLNANQSRLDDFLREPQKYSPYPYFTLNLDHTKEITPDELAEIAQMAAQVQPTKGRLQFVNVNKGPYQSLMNVLIGNKRLPGVAEIYTKRSIDEISGWMWECEEESNSVGLQERDIANIEEEHDKWHKSLHGSYQDIPNYNEMMRRRFEYQIIAVQQKAEEENPGRFLKHLSYEFGDITGILTSDEICRGVGGVSIQGSETTSGQTTPIDEGRPTGVCKWWNDRKNYGFIVPDDGGEDLFVLPENTPGGRGLEEGKSYSYTKYHHTKGWRAKDIKPL